MISREEYTMKQFRCVVENPIGIHARPAALLAQLCVGLKSQVILECNNMVANGNDVLQILALNAKKNDVINVKVEGINEEEDALKVKEIICNDCILRLPSLELKIMIVCSSLSLKKKKVLVHIIVRSHI